MPGSAHPATSPDFAHSGWRQTPPARPVASKRPSPAQWPKDWRFRIAACRPERRDSSRQERDRVEVDRAPGDLGPSCEPVPPDAVAHHKGWVALAKPGVIPRFAVRHRHAEDLEQARGRHAGGEDGRVSVFRVVVLAGIPAGHAVDGGLIAVEFFSYKSPCSSLERSPGAGPSRFSQMACYD